MVEKMNNQRCVLCNRSFQTIAVRVLYCSKTCYQQAKAIDLLRSSGYVILPTLVKTRKEKQDDANSNHCD